VWRGGEQGEPEQLRSCYVRSLAVATQVGARSIAFPAISTGAYGYPRSAAAHVAVDAVGDADPTQIDRIVLVAFDADTHDRYEHLLDQRA
jgi:O-acetyl-ADP-ribose deacetylase (regulator of RNase III)